MVTYTAPGSGASATFPGGNKAFTNFIGLASVNAKANTVAGGYSVAASTRGASSVNFSLTNTPAAATQLAIHTQPSATASAGVAFSTQPVVYVEDQYGNLETGDNATQVTAASLPMGSGPLQGTTTVTASGGIATFTNLADNNAETITIQFTSSPVLTAATSNSIVVTAPATQLVIHTQPSPTATAGVAFSTQPVVYVEDQYGNLETGDNTTQVTAALGSGTGPLLGTTTVTVSGGIATFTNLSDNTGRDDHAPVHQLAGPDRGDFQQHRGQPGGGEPVGDPHPALSHGDGRRGLQHAAGDLRRRPVRQPGDRRQQHAGDGRFAADRFWSAPGDDDGDGLGRHRHVHQPGGRHGRDHHAPLHQLAGSHRGDFEQRRDQPGGGEPVGDQHSAFSRRRRPAWPSVTQPVIYVEDQFGNLVTGDNTHAGDGRVIAGWFWSAARNDDGDGLRWHRHVHQPGGQHGRDHHAPVHQLAGPHRGDFQQHRGQSGGRPSQLVVNTQPSPTATAGVAFGTQPVVYVEDQYGNLETGDNTTQVTVALTVALGRCWERPRSRSPAASPRSPICRTTRPRPSHFSSPALRS